MAIFLLISIGSVCASDNADDISDSPLASTDDSVDVIGNGSGATQEKINTTVTATGDKEKYTYDEDKNITVKVVDNNSKVVEGINQSNLTVFKGNTSINFKYNNSILTITENLSVGTHNLTINYLGNSNYTNSSTTFLLKILGNKTLSADENTISDGNTIEITNVKVFDGVENITLNKDDIHITLTYINKTGNITSVNIADFNVENSTISFATHYKWLAANITLNYTDAVNNKTIIVKLATNITATYDEKIRDTEDKNITVYVLDSQNNPLNITKPDLKVLENKEDIAFTYNNSVITITKLAIGVHNLTIIYNGNATYATSNKTVTLGVWGNQTINPDKVATIDSDKNVTIVLNLSDGVDPVSIVENNLTMTLFYTVGNDTYNRTVTGFTVNDQNITFKVEETFDTAYVNILYAAETNLTAKVDLKIETAINCNDTIISGDSEYANFTVNVTASDDYPLNVTSDNLKVYEGNKLLNTSYNNSIITIHNKYKYGVYNLTIKFTGNAKYGDAVKDIVLKVYGIKLNNTAIDVNSTKIGEVKFNITNGEENFNFTKDDINITVNYQKDNATVNVPVASWNVDENGTLTFELENGNFTKATLTIYYKGASVNVTVNRIYNLNVVPINATAEYQDGNFTFLLLDLDTGEILANKSVVITINQNGTNLYFITKTGESSYSLGTTTTLTSDENGIITLKNKGFYPGLLTSDEIYAPAGEYNITITGKDDVKGKNTTNISILPIDVNITIEKYEEYYGSDKKIVIVVTNARTGKTISGVYILLNITGATLSNARQMTDVNGTIQLGVTGLYPNTYKMTFQANDTNLKNSTGSGSFKIIKIPTEINAKNVQIYYNTGTTYSFTVTENGKALSGMYILVRLYTTSSKYSDYLFQTNSKGKVSFSASLAVGKHKIIISTADTRYDASSVTKTITVKKASAKITANKVNTYYKGGKYLTVKLINKKNKKAIYDAKLNIKLYVTKTKYYNYNGKTGMNGKIKLSVDTLNPGTYKVVIKGASSKNFKASQITTKIVIKKAPTKLIPKKVSAKKGEKKYFKVTAKNKKTKKVIADLKLKVKVYTGKKAKSYTIKTNSKGVAKLSTAKIKVGTHKAVVTSKDKNCVAKAAKSTIKIKK